jgi:hypothetical protein
VPAVTTIGEPQVTSASPSLLRAVATELGRFSRRNTLAAVGGVVGLFIIFVALAPRCWRRAIRSRRTSGA